MSQRVGVMLLGCASAESTPGFDTHRYSLDVKTAIVLAIVGILFIVFGGSYFDTVGPGFNIWRLTIPSA